MSFGWSLLHGVEQSTERWGERLGDEREMGDQEDGWGIVQRMLVITYCISVG